MSALNACSDIRGVREWRRILRKNNKVWRSDVELKLRKIEDGEAREKKRKA